MERTTIDARPHFQYAPDQPWLLDTIAHVTNRPYFNRFIPEADSILTGIQIVPAVQSTGDPTVAFAIYDVDEATGELRRIADISAAAGRINQTVGPDVQTLSKYSTGFKPRVELQGGKPYYAAVRVGVADSTLTLVSALMGYDALMETGQSHIVTGLTRAFHNTKLALGASHSQLPFATEVPLIGLSYQRRVVCIGDSTTGTLGSSTATGDYPRYLGGMLGLHAYVMGAAVGGDTLALIAARLTTDVRDKRPLDVVVLAGVTDINAGRTTTQITADLASIYSRIGAYGTGINVKPATIMPYGKYSGRSAPKETVRLAVNDWIRNSSGLAYTDLDSMGDGAATPALQAAYDIGDGLHPSDAGDMEMARLIFQQSFRGQKAARLATVDG